MGAEERQSDADLTPEQRQQALTDATVDGYESRAAHFSYFRLLYLLERLFPKAPRLGFTGPVKNERIRLRGEPAMVFAASDVDFFLRRGQATLTFGRDVAGGPVTHLVLHKTDGDRRADRVR